MQVFLGIAYFVIGIVQLFAIVDGINHALGWGSFISFILGFMVTYIPVLGSVLGVYGAVSAWHWELLQAAALFFWYIPVVAVVALLGAVFDRR